jgi:acetyl-CoA acyltransferase 1
MGLTSEKDFNISRQIQDEFVAKSFQKAGKFKDEIVPIKIIITP